MEGLFTLEAVYIYPGQPLLEQTSEHGDDSTNHSKG